MKKGYKDFYVMCKICENIYRRGIFDKRRKGCKIVGYCLYCGMEFNKDNFKKVDVKIK